MAHRILHNSRKSITPRTTWKPVRVPQEFGNVTQSVPRCPRYEAAFYRLYNGRRIKTRQAQALSLLLRLKKNIAVKLFFDLFPIILFFGAFKFGESDPQTAADILTLITGGTGPEHAPVMLATLVAIVSTFVQIAIVFARGKKPEPMLWISLAVIVVFGSLTIWLQNEMFIKWKPSILYWIFGGILLFASAPGATTSKSYSPTPKSKCRIRPGTHFKRLGLPFSRPSASSTSSWPTHVRRTHGSTSSFSG